MEGLIRFFTEVARQAADDGCDGEPEGREEETLAVMTEGLQKVAVQDEPYSHGRADKSEEDQVEDIDSDADLSQSAEPKGLADDEDGQPSSTHR